MFESIPLWANLAIFAASAGVVWFAGTKLAVLADAIAERTGIGRALLGMVLLGGVTSLPELSIAVTATVRGTPVLTINDVLGSAAINLAVLAVADLIIGKEALTSVQGSAKVMLQGALGIILMAIPVGVALVGDVSLLGMGLSSWLMLAIYVIALRMISRTTNRGWKPRDAKEGSESEATQDEALEQEPLRKLVYRTIFAALAICGAGFLLTTSGESLAHQTGLGSSFFAIVFLAFATSLPEWSTVIGALRLRRYEMAMSDVLGTNLVNVVIIALVDAMYPGGPVLQELGATASIGALLALLLTAIYLVGMLERRDRTIFRMGYDSLAVLLVYAGGLVLLYLHS